MGFSLVPSPPFNNGTFTDGPNVLQQVEDILNVEIKSTFFVQPFQCAPTEILETTILPAPVVPFSGKVLIQKTLVGVASKDGARVQLTFRRTDGTMIKDVKCNYKHTHDVFELDKCSRGFTVGDVVDFVEEIGVKPRKNAESVTVELWYY